MPNYIIDIDGTVLDGNKIINNADTFIKQLQKNDNNFLLASNSIKSREEQANRLEQAGLAVSLEHFFSPIDSINQLIQSKNIKNVMVVGSPDRIEQIQANHTEQDPELIILLDFERNNFAYNDLQQLFDKIENGSKVISASGSPFYLRNGKKRIDTGAFVALLESISEQRVEILGKPSKHYFLNAQSCLAKEAESLRVIGDDWKTDIMGAKSVGFHAILIKSGKYSEGDELRANPDALIDSFDSLIYN